MTPEEKARVKIDQWFADAGWKVVNRDEYEPTISAVAIREGLLKGNLEADYFLFINGKAVGVLEAKREEINISSNIVSEQAITYAKSVPDCYQAWQKPLPFLFKSNGKETELGTFRLTETGDAFNAIYAVNRLKSAEVPTDSNVVICTIQRLFSLLKGEEITDTDDDDEDTLISKDFSIEEAQSTTDAFEQYCCDHCDDIVTLRSWKNY